MAMYQVVNADLDNMVIDETDLFHEAVKEAREMKQMVLDTDRGLLVYDGFCDELLV